ncbi:hypothetical protein GCK72_002268 [Caenorhabditis remanei]|uniref:DUF7087 domain-containing protein n=1 Tax=Caenorhabditis remanei TaxID=31234 RepID=A0A6A5HRX2_CAERE|nr:hypothetical protein GCK72_002268 [Caenorhabditis remanei]KAF1770449.1 hypothetical protein GCK72_002268 [Caenorhabditis remanei]
MDKIPPYDYALYAFAARSAVITCSIFELLQIFGSLEETSSFAKFIYFLFAGSSAAASAFNIAMSTDGRDEIRKVVGNPDCETRGKAAALVLSPVLAGLILFVCVSGNALFSFFVLIHVLISITQFGVEAYETFLQKGSGTASNNPYAQLANPSCGAPIVSEKKATSQFTEPLQDVKPVKDEGKSKVQTPVVQEPIYHTLERVQKEAEKKK